MLAVVVVTHTASAEIVATHTGAHRAFLTQLEREGKLVASGPLAGDGPRRGVILLEVADEAELDAIVQRDPYRQHDVATHDARPWSPTRGSTRMHAPRLANRVVLVTGASSGIGEATARAIANEGGAVTLAARRVERLGPLAASLAHAIAIPCDVTRDDDVKRAIDATVERFGKIDGVVNAAGVMLLAPVHEARLEDLRSMLELNVLGTMRVCRAVLPHLVDAGGGDIVNVSSLAGRIANPNASGYAASKFGVVGYSESLRREVYAKKVRVMVVEPGVVRTELGEHITHPGMKQNLEARLAAMRPLEAGDVAHAIVEALALPSHASVNEIVMRPTDQER